MKRLLAILCVPLVALAVNTPSGPVTKNPNTNAIDEDLKIGVGRRFEFDLGAFKWNAGSTFEGDATAFRTAIGAIGSDRSMRFGTGVPSAGLGIDGDSYTRLDSPYTTYAKESGSWVAKITFVETSDSRMSNARTPTAHASSHGFGGGDAITIAESQVTNLTADLAAKAPSTAIDDTAYNASTWDGVTNKAPTQNAVRDYFQSFLTSINSGVPNGTGAKVHWSQLTGVPAGFADGTDDGAGGGGAAISGTPTVNQVAVWLNSTTLQGVNAVGLGDAILGMSSAGIVKRTGANTYVPAVAGSDYEPPITASTNLYYWRGDKVFAVLDKTAVGLGNVPNTDATNATNIGSGTLGDARLSSNVPLKNAANTFTANQTVSTGASDGVISIDANAGKSKNLFFNSAGSARWTFFSTNEAESGSNAGSNFVISRWSDAGGYLGDSININRASGAVMFPEHATNFRWNGIGVTRTTAAQIYNDSVATNVLNQWSPSLVFKGDGWKTTGATRVNCYWSVDVEPTTGTTAPGNILTFSSDASDTPSLQPRVTFDNSGNIWTNGAVANTQWDQQIAAALGSNMLAMTLPPDRITTNTAMVSGTVIFQAIWLPKAATITGVRWYQTTAGAYTGDTSSQVGLYTYSGGTLTLVASCTDDTALWKATANTFGTKAFTSTYAAHPGLYFIGVLWHSSATTTAPALGATAAVSNLAALAPGTTNSAKFTGTLATQTALPSSQASSGITGTTSRIWLALY